MLYEMRLYTLVPHGVAEFERNFAQVAEERMKLSRLLGFFHSEIGDLNRIMLLWQYDNSEQRIKIRDKAHDIEGWPPPNRHLQVKQESIILNTPGFMPEPLSGDMGPFYEFRTYQVHVGKMQEMLDKWSKSAEKRREFSPLAACFVSEHGPLNQFIHVWPYRDLKQRAEIRNQAGQLPDWPPPTSEYFVSQKSEIWLPSSFSPMQ